MQWQALGFKGDPLSTDPISENTLALYTGNKKALKKHINDAAKSMLASTTTLSDDDLEIEGLEIKLKEIKDSLILVEKYVSDKS